MLEEGDIRTTLASILRPGVVWILCSWRIQTTVVPEWFQPEYIQVFHVLYVVSGKVGGGRYDTMAISRGAQFSGCLGSVPSARSFLVVGTSIVDIVRNTSELMSSNRDIWHRGLSGFGVASSSVHLNACSFTHCCVFNCKIDYLLGLFIYFLLLFFPIL